MPVNERQDNCRQLQIQSYQRKSHQGDKSELISREANFNADRCDKYFRGIVVQWRTIPRIAP